MTLELTFVALTFLAVGFILGRFVLSSVTHHALEAALNTEGRPPHRERCEFLATHECRCCLDRYHVEQHACVHGHVWGADYRHMISQPGGGASGQELES